VSPVLTATSQTCQLTVNLGPPGTRAQHGAIPPRARRVHPAGACLVTNLTAVDETADGYVTAYPAGTSLPAMSNLDYLDGQTLAGLALLATRHRPIPEAGRRRFSSRPACPGVC
jgi:hypothetical protein